MKILFIISVALPASAFASAYLMFGPTCTGVDGVPLTGAKVSKCCTDGRNTGTDNECLSGMNSMISDSINNMSVSMQVSSAAMNVVQGLNGVPTDLAAQTDSMIASNSGPSVVGAAMNAGSGPKLPAAMMSPNDSLNLQNDSKKDGAASTAGNSAASSAGGGVGLGSAGATSGLGGSGKPGGELLASKDSTGGYSQSAGVLQSHSTSDTSVSTDGLHEQQFNGAQASNNAEHSSAEDNESQGTAEDPSDYFKRIDKTADIFKIVSQRYGQKKSLWKTSAVDRTDVVPVIKR